MYRDKCQALRDEVKVVHKSHCVHYKRNFCTHFDNKVCGANGKVYLNSCFLRADGVESDPSMACLKLSPGDIAYSHKRFYQPELYPWW